MAWVKTAPAPASTTLSSTTGDRNNSSPMKKDGMDVDEGGDVGGGEERAEGNEERVDRDLDYDEEW